MRCTRCERTLMGCDCEGGPYHPLIDVDDEAVVTPSVVDEALNDATPAYQGHLLAERNQLPAQDERIGKVASRLFAKYGGGDKPRLRELLFARCERAAVQYGEPVLRIITSAVRSAESANSPGRYFCSTVTRRMREAGFFQDVDDCW